VAYLHGRRFSGKKEVLLPGKGDLDRFLAQYRSEGGLGRDERGIPDLAVYGFAYRRRGDGNFLRIEIQDRGDGGTDMEGPLGRGEYL